MASKTLFEGLGDGVNVRVLASHMLSKGVFVEIRCSRNRGTISMPPTLQQAERFKGEVKEAYKTYVSGGRFSIIPDNYDKALSQVESRIRYQLTKTCITDGFMSLSDFDAFKIEFAAAVDDYNALRDSIVDVWDDIVENFKAGLEFIISGYELGEEKAAAVRKEVYAAIPSKEDYRDSFRLEVRVRPFESQPDISLYPPALGKEMTEDWAETVVESATACIAACAQDVFTICSGIVSRYVDQASINGNSINGLASVASRVRRNNLFNNPLLESAADRLEKLQSIDNVDEQEMVIEEVLLDIYSYCKKNDVHLDIVKKGLTAKTLDQMLALRTA